MQPCGRSCTIKIARPSDTDATSRLQKEAAVRPMGAQRCRSIRKVFENRFGLPTGTVPNTHTANLPPVLGWLRCKKHDMLAPSTLCQPHNEQSKDDEIKYEVHHEIPAARFTRLQESSACWRTNPAFTEELHLRAAHAANALPTAIRRQIQALNRSSVSFGHWPARCPNWLCRRATTRRPAASGDRSSSPGIVA